MHPSRIGLWAQVVGFGLALASTSFADSIEKTIDDVAVPVTRPLRANRKSAIPRVASLDTAPSLPQKVAVPSPVAEVAADGESCANGAPCQSYYRNRPYGCHADRIKMQNRLGEPNWYRYYRCVHFGYHPTQWHPWPEGWLTCRYPQPGKHPYDIERPKPDKRILDRERRLQGERVEPDLLNEPLPTNPLTEPRQLPPPQNTTEPPITPGPGSVPNVQTPIIR